MTTPDPALLPRFDDFREPNQSEEPPELHPPLYPSVPSWAICGAAVAFFVGFVPEAVATLAREEVLWAWLMVRLIKGGLWALGGAIVGGIVGGLRDEYRRRQKHFLIRSNRRLGCCIGTATGQTPVATKLQGGNSIHWTDNFFTGFIIDAQLRIYPEEVSRAEFRQEPGIPIGEPSSVRSRVKPRSATRPLTRLGSPAPHHSIFFPAILPFFSKLAGRASRNSFSTPCSIL